MPSIDNASLVNEVRNQWPKTVADCLAHQTTFIKFLLANVQSEPPQANGPTWDARLSGHSGGQRTPEYGPYSSPDRAEDVEAHLNWAWYDVAIQITEEAMLKLALAGNGEAAKANLINEQMGAAFERLLTLIQVDWFGNDPTTGEARGIAGRPSIMSASNVYAGIDRATYTNWRAMVNSSGGAISSALLGAMHKSMVFDRKGSYGIIAGGYAQAEKAAKITAIEGGSTINQLVLPGQPVIQTAGLGGRDPSTPVGFYKGTPILAFPDYTDQVLDFWDLSQLRVQFIKPFTLGDLEKVPDAPLYKGIISCGLQFKFLNPFKGAGTLTGLS